MKQLVLNASFLSLACVVAGTAIFAVPLKAAADTELKDDTGKTIIRYVVEPPAGVAPAGTTDPARQVGLFLCFPEHDTPVDADISVPHLNALPTLPDERVRETVLLGTVGVGDDRFLQVLGSEAGGIQLILHLT